MFSFCPLSVQTLGDAWQLRWRITARCAWGPREGMKSIRECEYKRELDMQTLVWTRGRQLPCIALKGRFHQCNPLAQKPYRLVSLPRCLTAAKGRMPATDRP